MGTPLLDRVFLLPCLFLQDNVILLTLLSFSEFVNVLLRNIGTHVDPRLIIQRIEYGMEVAGLRDSLVKILHDYNLQVSIGNLRISVVTGSD